MILWQELLEETISGRENYRKNFREIVSTNR